MKISIAANVGGVQRMLEAEIEQLSDLNKPLRRLDKFLRFKVQRKFEQSGPGWPPLKQPSVARNTGKRMSSLGRKLERELKKAEKRGAKERTIEGRKNLIAEFKRLEAGGKLEESLIPKKRQQKLQQRIERAQNKAKRPLGRLAASIKSEIKQGSLRVFSEVDWSAVHNDGGTAGRGAKIPQREFLAIEDEDLEALAGFILDALDDKAET